MTANRPLLKWSLRLLLCWVMLSALGAVAGRTIIDGVLPVLGGITQNISDDFYVKLEWDEENPRMLMIRANFGIPKPEIQAMGINPGAKVSAGTNVEHILVPVILLLTVVICWPVARLRQRITLVLLGIPAALLTLGLTTPFLLAGKVESLLQEHASAAGIERAEPLFLKWMLFTEVGGRWLLPIVLGLGCVWLLHWLSGAKPDERDPAESGA